ncbi:MAG: thiamine-monophosphate kinase [Verrucomicrobiales bacterium]|nr:thiamine-monophosphate kinase [Verrucomicrobiales bacterium]|tara:strand:- start:9453 stop:10361 length:909 start_codon:yes stop_codon:yes gene_type:complete
MQYKKASKISDIGEDSFIDLVTKKLISGKDVIAAAGDDCAVIKNHSKDSYTLLKTDSIVEGIHYLTTDTPQAVGYKAMARSISDIAAMGGTPQYALVTLILNPKSKISYLQSIYRGLTKAASKFKISIVGGETTRAGKNSTNSISISMTGTVPKNQCCFRTKGKPGQLLYVTGRLGGSLKGKHLKFTPRIKEANWLVKKFKPTAMMDLSDGLASDLPKLAKASNCGYEINLDALPKSRGSDIKSALSDGEDYELLFSISPQKSHALEKNWGNCFSNLKLTQIGALRSSNIHSPKLEGGWQHF